MILSGEKTPGLGRAAAYVQALIKAKIVFI